MWASWLLTSQLLWEAKGSAWQPRCNSDTGTAQEQQQVNWWIPAPFWHLECNQIFTSLMTSNCQSKGREDSPTSCSILRSQFPETGNRMPFVNGQLAYLMPDCISLTPTFSLVFMWCIHIFILQLLQGRLCILPSVPKEILNQGWNFRSFKNCWLQQSLCWDSVWPKGVSGPTLSQLNPMEWSQLWEGHFWHSAPQQTWFEIRKIKAMHGERLVPFWSEEIVQMTDSYLQEFPLI